MALKGGDFLFQERRPSSLNSNSRQYVWLWKKKRRMQMVQQGIRATSKSSLKLQCLFCAKGDLKEAKELYDFFAGDMPDLPDYDPVPLTWQQNTAQTVNGIMGWLKENQGTLAQAYDFIQGIIKKRGSVPDTPPVDSPLPPIN